MGRKVMHTQYVEQMTTIISKRNPTLDKTSIRKVILDDIKKTMLNDVRTINFEGNDVPIMKIDKLINHEELIVAGSGSLYMPHKKSVNILLEMIQYLIDQRKVYKNLKFENKKAGDKELEDFYDGIQKVFKEFNNSFFGVTAEPNSIFYNPMSGPAITGSGKDIITVAVNIFEKFLGNSIFFRDYNDAIIYVNNIITSDNTHSDALKFRTVPSVEKVVNYLCDKIDNLKIDDYEYLTSTLTPLSDMDLIRVYYKNNMSRLMNESDIVEKYFHPVLGDREFPNPDPEKGMVKFMDPNEPPEQLVESLDRLWDVVKEFGFDNHQDYYRFENMFENEGYERKRRSVLTIDTDSNFLYLDPLMKELEKLDDSVELETRTGRVITVNVIMYLVTKLINETYDKYGKEIGIPDDKTHLINMKNELYLERIILTEAKKQYASIIAMQEGVLLTEPELDIKGLAIKKANTNKKVRDVFQTILEEDILKESKINLGKIIKKYKTLEEEITESFTIGLTKYAIPTKVNSAQNYKLPYNMDMFRGAILWNKLNPHNTIQFPARVNKIKLNSIQFKDIQDSVKDPALMKLFEEVFRNEELVKSGLDVICIPDGVDMIPEVFIPHINILDMVNANIKSGLPLLKSLDVVTLPILKNEYATNIIRI